MRFWEILFSVRFASGSRAARADVSSSRIQCNNPSSCFSDFLGDLRLFFDLCLSIDFFN